jgi:hypothetical protein
LTTGPFAALCDGEPPLDSREPLLAEEDFTGDALNYAVDRTVVLAWYLNPETPFLYTTRGHAMNALCLPLNSRGCSFMKRIGLLFGSALLMALVTGCDSGLKEGLPDATSASGPQTSSFQEEMKKQAEKMKMKRPTKKAAEPEPSAPEKPAT